MNAGIETSPPRTTRRPAARRMIARNGIVFLATFIGASTASMLAMRGDHPVTAAMTFVIVVLINGTVGGLAQGLLAAVLGSAIYTFFIRFPVYSAGLSVVDDLVPILALTLTATMSGVLSGRLKDRARGAERAQSQLTRLLQFSTDLQSALDLRGIIDIFAAAIADRSRLEALLGQIGQGGGLREIADWNRAVAEKCAALPREPRFDEAEESEKRELLDERTALSLARLAIERSELLQEQSSAVAAMKSEALKTALLSSLSHDLLTPLASISASASSLRRFGAMLDKASQTEMLETIEEQCARLEDFAGKLISLGRLEGGLAPGDLEVVDLGEAIGSALAGARRTAPDRCPACVLPERPVLTLAHPALLDQVLRNVLENAVRYSEPGGAIALSLTVNDGQAVLSITDNGMGLPADDLQRVFTRFYRGRNAVGTQGHGLGLSIAKTFIESLDGTIALISPVAHGKGTQVRITLPIARTAIPEADFG